MEVYFLLVFAFFAFSLVSSLKRTKKNENVRSAQKTQPGKATEIESKSVSGFGEGEEKEIPFLSHEGECDCHEELIIQTEELEETPDPELARKLVYGFVIGEILSKPKNNGANYFKWTQ